MKGRIETFIILLLIIVILVNGLVIRQNHQKLGQKYQVCLEKCDAEDGDFGLSLLKYSEYVTCREGCKEEYEKINL